MKVLMFLLIAAPLAAQTSTQLVPTAATVLVVSSSGTVVAQQRTTISASLPLCNKAPAPAPTLPLINPQFVDVEDPFQTLGSGKVCSLPVPGQIPNGQSYTAYVTFSNDTVASCQDPITGNNYSPCVTPRSPAGVPPFTVAGLFLAPPTPRNVVPHL